MLKKPRQGLFVTGTDTDVGKTFVTALLARGWRNSVRVGVYKPVASGCEYRDGKWISSDAEALWIAAGQPLTLSHVTPQCFAAALAPNLAAHAEGRKVDGHLLRKGIEPWEEACDLVLVEGAGGLMSPVSDTDLVADVAVDLGYPLIVVAPNRLGVINQVLQTLVAAQHYRLRVAGIVLNQVQVGAKDASLALNGREIARLADVPLLAEVTFGTPLLEEAVAKSLLATLLG